MNGNDSVANNCLCSVCGGNHNVLKIGLENGGHIITRPSCKRKAIRIEAGDGKRKATKLDLVDIFWPDLLKGYLE